MDQVAKMIGGSKCRAERDQAAALSYLVAIGVIDRRDEGCSGSHSGGETEEQETARLFEWLRALSGTADEGRGGPVRRLAKDEIQRLYPGAKLSRQFRNPK
jgi:hypothetical protein